MIELELANLKRFEINFTFVDFVVYRNLENEKSISVI